MAQLAKDQHCHCCGSGHSCALGHCPSTGLIPGLGTSACTGVAGKKNSHCSILLPAFGVVSVLNFGHSSKYAVVREVYFLI